MRIRGAQLAPAPLLVVGLVFLGACGDDDSSAPPAASDSGGNGGIAGDGMTGGTGGMAGMAGMAGMTGGTGGDGMTGGTGGDGMTGGTGGDGMDDAVAAQLASGAQLYADNCATCHGADSSGTNLGPALVGDGALPLDPPAERNVRTGQFRTAADVFAFASENMPASAPGSLNDSTYLDILAFVLDENDVTLEAPLTTDNASDIVINP